MLFVLSRFAYVPDYLNLSVGLGGLIPLLTLAFAVLFNPPIYFIAITSAKDPVLVTV